LEFLKIRKGNIDDVRSQLRSRAGTIVQAVEAKPRLEEIRREKGKDRIDRENSRIPLREFLIRFLNSGQISINIRLLNLSGYSKERLSKAFPPEIFITSISSNVFSVSFRAEAVSREREELSLKMKEIEGRSGTSILVHPYSYAAAMLRKKLIPGFSYEEASGSNKLVTISREEPLA
jgi:hypothetical protein